MFTLTIWCLNDKSRGIFITWHQYVVSAAGTFTLEANTSILDTLSGNRTCGASGFNSWTLCMPFALACDTNSPSTANSGPPPTIHTRWVVPSYVIINYYIIDIYIIHSFSIIKNTKCSLASSLISLFWAVKTCGDNLSIDFNFSK